MGRFAFLVGSNAESAEGFEPLRYAEADARRMADVLGRPAVGYAVQRPEEAGDALALLRQFEAFARRCGPEDTLLFYFSGHGLLLREHLYLVCDRTSDQALVTSALPVGTVKLIMSQSRASAKLLVLDCCHSGSAVQAGFRGPGGVRARTRLYEDNLDQAAAESGSVILAACATTGLAREDPRLKSGFLTSLLVRAFGDDFHRADANEDGVLSAEDLMAWLSAETKAANRRRRDGLVFEPPRMYGEFSSHFQLTPCVRTPAQQRDKEFEARILQAVEAADAVFRGSARVEPGRLRILAVPVKRAATGLTSLAIVDQLFRLNSNAAVFAAATLLWARRERNFLKQLVARLEGRRFRGAVLFRVLKAIRLSLVYHRLPTASRRLLGRRLDEIERAYRKDHYIMSQLRRLDRALQLERPWARKARRAGPLRGRRSTRGRAADDSRRATV